MKKCTKCEQILSSGDFNKNKTTKDGLGYWCKDCLKKLYRTPGKRKRKKRASKARSVAMKKRWEKLHSTPELNIVSIQGGKLQKITPLAVAEANGVLTVVLP